MKAFTLTMVLLAMGILPGEEGDHSRLFQVFVSGHEDGSQESIRFQIHKYLNGNGMQLVAISVSERFTQTRPRGQVVLYTVHHRGQEVDDKDLSKSLHESIKGTPSIYIFKQRIEDLKLQPSNK